LLTTLAKLLFHHGSVEHDASHGNGKVNSDFRSIFGARSFMTAMCVASIRERTRERRGRWSPTVAGHPRQRGDGVNSLDRAAIGFNRTSRVYGNRHWLRSGGRFSSLYRWSVWLGEGRTAPSDPQRLEKMLDHSAPSAEALLKGILTQVAPDNAGDVLPDDLAALAVRRAA